MHGPGCTVCDAERAERRLYPPSEIPAAILEQKLQALREEAAHVSAVRHSSRMISETAAVPLAADLADLERDIEGMLRQLGRTK